MEPRLIQLEKKTSANIMDSVDAPFLTSNKLGMHITDTFIQYRKMVTLKQATTYVSTDEVPKRAKIHSCDRCQVVLLFLLL